MVNQMNGAVIIIPYWLQKTKNNRFHEREASVMSKASSLKPEEVYLDTPLRTSRSLFI